MGASADTMFNVQTSPAAAGTPSASAGDECTEASARGSQQQLQLRASGPNENNSSKKLLSDALALDLPSASASVRFVSLTHSLAYIYSALQYCTCTVYHFCVGFSCFSLLTLCLERNLLYA